MGGKSRRKNVPRNPLHSLLEKSAEYLTCAHSFHWPDPWNKKGLRTEEPAPAWITATEAQQIVEPLGHTEE